MRILKGNVVKAFNKSVIVLVKRKMNNISKSKYKKCFVYSDFNFIQINDFVVISFFKIYSKFKFWRVIRILKNDTNRY